MDATQPPLVLAFVGDLYFSVRIESTGRAAGCKVELVESASQLMLGYGSAPGSPLDVPGEMDEKLSHSLIETIAERGPAVLIFDLDYAPIPALDWIRRLKSDAGTAGYTVVAFGSHVNVKQQQAARQAGADQVLAKSRFVQILPDLLSRIATGGT